VSSKMNFRLTLLAAVAALPASAFAQTPIWSAAGAPVQSTLTAGPWTLGLYTAPHNLLTSPPAQTDYCLGGAINLNANPAASVMAPFYFPQVIGEGLNVFGLFNYRPKGQNELTIAGKSADGGKTWTWLDQALQASTACPTANAADGNDTGLGHPYMLSFGGANYLYLLDRRGGHVDVDGLTVHRIAPQVAAPLHASPALDTTIVATGPANNTGVIAGWDFTNYPINKKVAQNSPLPDIGTTYGKAHASATALGMTNSYWCSMTQNTSSMGAGYGSLNFDDIDAQATASSVATSNEWRIRGEGSTNLTGSGAYPCNGWDLDAPQYSQGVQFNFDTTGHAKVLLQYDWFSTNQGFHNLQVRYSLNVNATPPVWTNIGPLQIASPNAYINQLTADFSSIAGAGNNPNFGVQLVGAYDPTLPAGSYTDGDYKGDGNTDTVNYGAGGEYTGATPQSNGSPSLYNDNSGNWRFSNVKLYDAAQYNKDGGSGTTTTDYSVETTGLLNPDGIVAVIPTSTQNTSKTRLVLYVQKQLSAALPQNACGNPVPTGNTINYDIDTIRLASTKDGIHFTDLGATNLLDPTTTSNLGIRYAAPNGSIVKFANGTFGLFFGAGNCEDGDSDGFHAIVFAQNTDSTYLNWTYVNNMNNPIAEISYSKATPTTPPLTGVSSEVNGGQNYWFGGRTYNPQAFYLNANQVSLVFAGYNYGYFGTDLSSYRTIGQITLNSSLPLIP